MANKRCEMWSNLRAWLERGAIPDGPRLADDLTAIEYGYNADNAIQFEKKEHLRSRGFASPDWADALTLTLAEPVQPRDLPEYLNPITSTCTNSGTAMPSWSAGRVTASEDEILCRLFNVQT